jgi:hypothetical protein
VESRRRAVHIHMGRSMVTGGVNTCGPITSSTLGRDAKVYELIDNDTRWWNIPMVKEIFTEEEARVICGLPICPGTQVDRMVWGAAKNGKFTVRSAYHVAKTVGIRYLGGSSKDSSTRSLWRRIWRLNGPRVVKMFMWQACNNILPTNENLFKRKVLSRPLLPHL